MLETMLVTGGAGFIGSNFVRHALNATERRVVVADKLTYAGNLASLADVATDPRYHFVEVDIADGPAMAQLFAAHRPSWVINFAAETHVDRSIDGPRAFVHTNIIGVFELLEVARRYLRDEAAADRARFRFLHVSTDEVYGSLGSAGNFSEDSPYAPNSPYAATKAGGDHLSRAYFATFGLPVIITNSSNNYGPDQFPEKLIPLMILNALDARPLPIYGNGGNVRDWLYVEDHCAGLLRALEVGRVGEKYNFGGDAERSNLEVVDQLCLFLDELAPIRQSQVHATRGVDRYAALRSFVPDRPGHDLRYAIDATRARKELGWCPGHSFTVGLRRTVQWYVANRAWCETVQQGKDARARLGLGGPAPAEVGGKGGSA